MHVAVNLTGMKAQRESVKSKQAFIAHADAMCCCMSSGPAQPHGDTQLPFAFEAGASFLIRFTAASRQPADLHFPTSSTSKHLKHLRATTSNLDYHVD